MAANYIFNQASMMRSKNTTTYAAVHRISALPIKHRMKKILALYMLCSALTACAPHQHTSQNIQTTSAQGQESSIVLESPDSALVSFIISNPPGATAHFTNTTFGASVNATAGKSYWCGLGTPCRKGQISDGWKQTEIAVCKIDGTWRAVPNIYFNVRRTR